MEKIVYLLGAGATQAEIDFIGVEANITVEGINRNVVAMSKSRNGRYYRMLQHFGIPEEQDIELMISLFEGFSSKKIASYSPYLELRTLYREYLVSQISRKKINPRLLSTLLYLYKNFGKYLGDEGEQLTGILTTNYDSLGEDAFHKVYHGFNYGLNFYSKNYKMKKFSPLLLKVHGSFNWEIKDSKLKAERRFERARFDERYAGWVPPSVYKKPFESKIFFQIWKQAQKILIDCDILRVVGSSLRNEDWTLISLIFTSQIESKKVFNIELIVPDESASGVEGQFRGIMQRLPFLSNLKPLRFLPGFARDEIIEKNVFHYWLLKKISEIERRNNKITTDEFLNKTLYGGE